MTVMRAANWGEYLPAIITSAVATWQVDGQHMGHNVFEAHQALRAVCRRQVRRMAHKQQCKLS